MIKEVLIEKLATDISRLLLFIVYTFYITPPPSFNFFSKLTL